SPSGIPTQYPSGGSTSWPRATIPAVFELRPPRTAASVTAAALIAAAVALSAATADARMAPDPLRARTPEVPRIPLDFRGTGRYIVRDLGVNVPFTWQGRGGDSQMIAGGPQYPIWFTNLIYRGSLYTLTYKWPNLPPDHPCSKIPGFNLTTLNGFLTTARFVGREIVRVVNRRRAVNHWRGGGGAWPPRPGGGRPDPPPGPPSLP